jgi:hypothetical protein
MRTDLESRNAAIAIGPVTYGSVDAVRGTATCQAGAARVSIEIRVLGHAWLAQACVVQDVPRERAQALPPGRSGVNEADAPDPSGCLHALHGQVVLPVGGLGVDDRHAMAVGHPLAERCGGRGGNVAPAAFDVETSDGHLGPLQPAPVCTAANGNAAN